VHYVIRTFLLPFSWLYCFVAIVDKLLCRRSCQSLPVVSVGNLVVGGSGKTPVIKELAKRYENVAVVLRGYGRKSRGLVQVSKKGEILIDVEQSGDEAMELALALKDACVYVSEDRKEAIERAKKDGARVVFLDDGFRHCIAKFDILLKKPTPNRSCLPAGPYRLPPYFEKLADVVLEEGNHFTKEVHILHPTEKMVLLTSIADPARLDPYLPPDIPRYAFEDHHFFTQKELDSIWRKERPTSFLVTRKDLVKLEKFDFRYSILDLRIHMKPKIVERIDHYIRNFDAKKDTDCPDAT